MPSLICTEYQQHWSRLKKAHWNERDTPCI